MKKNVLLLGAGYANMSLLKNINQSVFDEADFTLINNTNYHYNTVLLHEVASGHRKESVLFDLRESLSPKINIIQDSVIEIKKDEVICKDNTYKYDVLIVGLGFSSDSFGIKGVQEYASAIENFDSALDIYNDIVAKVRNYKNSNDKNDLKFIVCGGGFTGAEFVSSLACELDLICKNENVDRSLVEIFCIEAMPKILPMFNDDLISIGLNKLKEMGVEVLTNSKITEVKQHSLLISQNDVEKEIFANTIVWTAGVKGNVVIQNSPFFKSGRSKVEVDSHLQPTKQEVDMNNIFIIGDCAAVMDKNTNRFFPPTAQISNKQGEYLAKILPAFLQGNAINEDFSFTSSGSICSLGNSFALSNAFNRSSSGYLAYLLKYGVEATWRYKLGGFGSIFKSH